MTQAQTTFPYSIDGLDPTAALRRMEDDIELYAALLRDFIDTEKDAAQVITDAVARGDQATATRRAHTVKGLAGTFGAVRLHPAAQSLETALREGAPAAHIDELLAHFEAALISLVEALEAGLPPEHPADTELAPVDPGQLARVCRELIDLTANWDVAARRLLDSHAPMLRAAFPDDFAPLQSALRDFDFDAATDRLSSACARAGVQLEG